MSKLHLAYPIRSDAGTLAGGSWETDLPLANLQTRYLTQVARSTSAALLDAQLRADLGSDRAVRLASLHNHNLSLAARVRLRGWEDGGTRNSTATYVDDAGIVRTAAIDVTRHYHYIGGVRTTKLQMARTNLVIQSENFGATWSTIGTPTRSAAAHTASGVTLDLIGDDAGGALEGYQQAISFTGDAAKAISIHLKEGTTPPGGYTEVQLRQTSSTVTVRLRAQITWSGGVPTVAMVTGTELRDPEPLADGVYRFHFQSDEIAAAETNALQVYPAASGVADTGNVYAGGVQAENGPFPTSYIPTTTSSASRAVDIYRRPFSFSPAEVFAAGGATLRAKFVEGGTHLSSDFRLWTVGTTATNAQWYIRGDTATGGYRMVFPFAGTFPITTVAPAIWDTVELLAELETRDNAGTEEVRSRIRQSINGAESGTSVWSAWTSMADAVANGWAGSQDIWLNVRHDSANAGSNNFILVDAKLGAGSIAFDDPPTEHTLLNPYEGGWEDAYPDIYAAGDVVDGEAVTSLKPRAEDIGGSFTPDFFHLLDETLSYRYWSVEINDTANPAGYVQAGRLVLAPVWEPPHGMSVGASYQLDDGTKETRIRSGGYAYDSQPGGRMSDFQIELMAVERAMLLSDLRRRITPGVQFVLVDDQWGVRHRHRNSFLATLVETVPLNAAASLYLSSPFKAREEL